MFLKILLFFKKILVSGTDFRLLLKSPIKIKIIKNILKKKEPVITILKQAKKP